MLKAKKMGVEWYDAGWIFPHGATEKQKGLTYFKTRFGGEPHRSFFAELDLSLSVSKDPNIQAPKTLLKKILEKIHGKFLP
jgi:hypothetical protein